MSGEIKKGFLQGGGKKKAGKAAAAEKAAALDAEMAETVAKMQK